MTNLTQNTQPKADGKKLIAALANNLKSFDDYIQRRKDMENAFKALEAKKAKVETEGKEALRNAGVVEAKRLLGQVTEEEAKSQDVNLSAIHEQKSRLDAAAEALRQQQGILETELQEHVAAMRAMRGQLSSVLTEELNNEMMAVAARATSILNQLHALNKTVGVSGSFAQSAINSLEIPSLITGYNMVKQPYHYSPRSGETIPDPWQEDDEAVALHHMLKPFDTIRHQLETYERQRKIGAA